MKNNSVIVGDFMPVPDFLSLIAYGFQMEAANRIGDMLLNVRREEIGIFKDQSTREDWDLLIPPGMSGQRFSVYLSVIPMLESRLSQSKSE